MGKLHKNNNYRRIYEEAYGKIPKGYHIHHIDGNPLNNSIDNLVALSPKEHAKVHEKEFVLWASEAGKLGGNKCKEEKIGIFSENYERPKSIVMPEDFAEKQSKVQTELYRSGKRKHWTTLYTSEEVSKRISQGDPGKSNRGKSSWNKGKTFTNSEEAKEKKRLAALNRKRYTCELCGKSNLDSGNLKQHLRKCKLNIEKDK